MSVNGNRWTAGADGVAPRRWSDEVIEMPSGRLHAVRGAGLFSGRAVCLAPVILLDPLDWHWPTTATRSGPCAGSASPPS
jgi:hypothetical protein